MLRTIEIRRISDIKITAALFDEDECILQHLTGTPREVLTDLIDRFESQKRLPDSIRPGAGRHGGLDV